MHRSLLAGLIGFIALHAIPALGVEPHIEVRGLADGFVHEVPVDWIEVGGYTWTGDSPFLDVMLTIDLSLSTFLASGADIDGDGRVGWVHPLALGFQRGPLGGANTFSPRLMSMDQGDSVIRAELLAARRFIEGVDFSRTRVGVVTFSKAASLRSPLKDSAGPLIDVLDRLVAGERQRVRLFSLNAGTNTSKALAVAAAELLRAEAADATPRRREVVLLTDGMPTKPKPVPERRLVATAMVLQERGIGTHFFPLGPIGVLNTAFFEFVDEHAGTRHTMVGNKGDIVEKLPQARLDRVRELEVENQTLAKPGRALRLFADGSFDAVVPLSSGANRLAFRVTTNDDVMVEVFRVVHHVPTPSDTPEGAKRQREALEGFAKRLEERRVESELVLELEAAHDRAVEQERRISIEVERSVPAK